MKLTSQAAAAQRRQALTREEREIGLISLARVAEISHGAFDELLARAEGRKRPKGAQAPKRGAENDRHRPAAPLFLSNISRLCS